MWNNVCMKMKIYVKQILFFFYKQTWENIAMLQYLECHSTTRCELDGFFLFFLVMLFFGLSLFRVLKKDIIVTYIWTVFYCTCNAWVWARACVGVRYVCALCVGVCECFFLLIFNSKRHYLNSSKEHFRLIVGVQDFLFNAM